MARGRGRFQEEVPIRRDRSSARVARLCSTSGDDDRRRILMHPRVRLGQSPRRGRPLGVGCWAWGDRRYWHYEEDHGPRDVVDAFDACLTARAGSVRHRRGLRRRQGEKLLGWLARRKSGREIVVATKYAPIARRGGPAAIPKGLAGSLKRRAAAASISTSCTRADRDEVPIAATMDAFADAVEAGQVRAVGVSNFRGGRDARSPRRPRATRRAAGDEPGALLASAPLAGSRRRARHLSRARRDAPRLQPARAGPLCGKYDAEIRPADACARRRRGSRPTTSPPRSPWSRPARRSAALHGVDAAAVALAWLLAKPDVVPLAGAQDGRAGDPQRESPRRVAQRSRDGRARPPDRAVARGA